MGVGSGEAADVHHIDFRAAQHSGADIPGARGKLASVIRPGNTSPSTKEAPDINIEHVVSGKIYALQIDLGTSLSFGDDGDDDEFDISPQDQQAFELRQRALVDGTTAMSKDFFVEAFEHAKQVRGQHAQHRARLSKKKRNARAGARSLQMVLLRQALGMELARLLAQPLPAAMPAPRRPQRLRHVLPPVLTLPPRRGHRAGERPASSSSTSSSTYSSSSPSSSSESLFLEP
ncbi:unnamed protein product [Prorocentrum cordatum]|uniref:Condensin complex subunit 2 n=1 Tax=Prorocentrum cordatum TaxID=2364126 RepID=A0ABN9SYC4_9DINO|nr:unnamed protein product [Polarella glacialis]